MASSDIERLKKSLKSMGPKHFLILAAIVAGVYGLQILGGMSFSRVDRTSYRAVAEYFVTNNATIANKIGKVTDFSVLGSGGSSSPSYNAYRVRGENGSGMVHMTIVREDDGKWYVTAATLNTGGPELEIPVSRRGESRSIRPFD